MKYDCYVYRCLRCGEDFYINKAQNQMQLFTCKCKCKYPKNEYLFLGEGDCDLKKIHKVEYNDEKSELYIRSRLSKNCRNNVTTCEFNIENKE